MKTAIMMMMVLKMIYIIVILMSGCLFCRAYSTLEPQIDVQEEHDWNAAAQRYPNLLETPSFIFSS